MKTPYLFVLAVALSLLSGACKTLAPGVAASPAGPLAPSFVPIDPITYNEFFAEPLWEVAPERDELLAFFPNEAVQVRVAKYSSSGQVTFTTVALSAQGENYEVIVDYAKYRTDVASDTVYQSGVGIRMRANVITLEAGIDVSSLFGIGLAAKSGKVSGTLRFETIGIGGKQISPLIPLPSEISVESIQAAMQAAAAIKSNLYDSENVSIQPQVFAFKPLPADQRIQEIPEVDFGPAEEPQPLATRPASTE